ncbi:MAG: TetR/AcrR family transcriptional regulator [Actinomycetota bacterium]
MPEAAASATGGTGPGAAPAPVPAGPVPAGPARIRDPARKERILAAAADLVAGHGYHAVSISDIGAAAGVTGPAIYRHFDSKSAVLVALFDQVIDGMLASAAEIVSSAASEHEALAQLVANQVEFVIGDRELARVYHHEINNLPTEDRRRLRRKQRLYLEEWVHVVAELRGGLPDEEGRALVHAAIGVIQSALFHHSALPQARLAELLTTSARAVLAAG